MKVSANDLLIITGFGLNYVRRAQIVFRDTFLGRGGGGEVGGRLRHCC